MSGMDRVVEEGVVAELGISGIVVVLHRVGGLDSLNNATQVGVHGLGRPVEVQVGLRCRLNIIMQHRCAKIRRKFVSGRKSSKVFWVCG